MALRAGLEPAAYCLGGKPEPGQTTPIVAQAALTLHDNRLTLPDAAQLLLTLAPNLAPSQRGQWVLSFEPRCQRKWGSQK
jgi:hypothetical protein